MSLTILRVIDIIVAVTVPIFMLYIGRTFTNREASREDQLQRLEKLQEQIYENSLAVNKRLSDLEVSTKVHDNLLNFIVSSLHLMGARKETK